MLRLVVSVLALILLLKNDIINDIVVHCSEVVTLKLMLKAIQLGPFKSRSYIKDAHSVTITL